MEEKISNSIFLANIDFLRHFFLFVYNFSDNVNVGRIL